MIDLKDLRRNPDLYRAAATNKRIDVDIDQLMRLDAEHRTLLTDRQALVSEKNQIGKQIAKLAGQKKKAPADQQAELAAEIERVQARPAQIKQQEQELEKQIELIEPRLEDLLLRVPQPPDEEVPVGVDDTDNGEIRRGGEPRQFDFEPKDHVTLGQALGMIDVERGVKLAGTRSYFLKGAGTLMHQAVLRLAFDMMLERGFEALSVPTMVREPAMRGTGYLPAGLDQCYVLSSEEPQQFLVGTAEVPLTAYHMDEILDEAQLPRRYVALSPCFRREAGTYGKDTAGLFRIHQFDKVEQVIVCRNDTAESIRWHETILENAEAVMEKLEMPYRVVRVCSGDLGQGQAAKFDIETWMPSRQGYAETHSASRFYDFQARRLRMRYRDGQKKTHFCHTLNNTVIASPRILIPLMELNQDADGSIRVPEALRPYLNGLERIEAGS